MEGDFFISAVSSLSPKFLYEGAGTLAYWAAGTVTLPLLFFSLVKRTGGEIFSTFSGGNVQWVKLMGAFLGWTILLTIYFSFCQLIFDSFNVLYRFSDAMGGEEATLRKFNEYYDRALSYTSDRDMVDKTMDFISMPITGASLIFYKLSLLVYLSADTFIKWAQAIGFATAFYWGLIAIPYSLNSEQDSNFIKYWKVMFTTSLLWPVIHGFTQWLVSQGFVDMFDSISPMFGKGKTPMVDLASVYNTFTLLHFVLFLTQGLALAIVVGLVATGSVSALNNMAMGGALAVGAIAYSAMSKGMGKFNRDNLRSAGQGAERTMAGGRDLARKGANALGNIVDKINPKPNNGYSFANNGPSVGGKVEDSRFQLNGGEKPTGSSRLDNYMAASSPMTGGSTLTSGYGSLGKGKSSSQQGGVISEISNAVDFKAPPKKLAGGSEKMTGYGSNAKPKVAPNTNSNTDRSDAPKSNKLDPYVTTVEPLQGGAKPTSGYGGLGKGKSTADQSGSSEAAAGTADIVGSKKLTGGAKPSLGYSTAKPVVESTVHKSAHRASTTTTMTAKNKPIVNMSGKANMASKAKNNIRASGQAEGSDREQPKKPKYTEKQKRDRKNVFVRKALEKNKGKGDK